MADDQDVESGQGSSKVSHWRTVFDQGLVTPEILKWHYDGSGTEEDPYVVTWIDKDPRNPMLWSTMKKWSVTMLVAFATLAVAFVSSAYTGGISQLLQEFRISSELATLGVSLFVLGFALGPLIWAPLSELYGRQYLFIVTFGALTAFNAGAAGAQNIQTLIILRFFAGAFGSSPLTNAGGVIADLFPAAHRGVAMALFSAAPFMGPVLGPIVGGFVGETVGWRWVEGVMAIFVGVFWIALTLLLPETYAPVLLRKRAEKLSKMTGKVYKSRSDVEQGSTTLGHAVKAALTRPWILLFREPIVFLLSIYMAIVYGTLYMLFAAFPIVYQQQRGWSEGIGGLAFLGVAIGMVGSVAYSVWDNKRYIKVQEKHDGFAPPEARLPGAMVGGIAIPVGLFWFAWTNSPSLPWAASIAAGIPFGFGMVLVFLGIMNYLVDAYTIFAASVLAANAVIRSLFGAAFPLFTSYMYADLGIHWASTIPAFLALLCVPMPFLFYKFGPAIRKRCKFAAESDAFMRRLQQQEESESDDERSEVESKEDEREKEAKAEEDLAEAPRFERIRTGAPAEERPGLERIKTGRSARSSHSTRSRTYEENPYHIDRVNTRDSFKSRPSFSGRSNSRTGRQ